MHKMFGGINPKRMQAVMKQMGMSQTEIPTKKIIVEKEDGNKLIFNEPSLMKIKMQGQESYQLTGEVVEESAAPETSEEDIKTIMEKTNCSKEKAIETLKKTGDLAEAILELTE